MQRSCYLVPKHLINIKGKFKPLSKEAHTQICSHMCFIYRKLLDDMMLMWFDVLQILISATPDHEEG